jgi:hypothetical protein
MLRPDAIATEEEIASDPSAKKKSGELWRHPFRWHFVVLLAAIVFVGAVRWRLLDTPLERDEGEFAYAGQLLLQGIPPYQLAYTMKLPGTSLAYAATLAVFGQTARGIHLGLLLVNAASIILLYAIAARLFGALARTVAGASYALLSTHPDVTGFAAHATHFVVLAALVGVVLLLRAEETGRPVYFFWSGLAFGIAFLMKQPGILLGAFAFFYLAVQSWPKNKREWAPWAKNLGVFLFAGALPFALTCFLLYRAGTFRNFWFWTSSYSSQYATIEPWYPGLRNLTSQCGLMLRRTPALWALAGVGFFAAFWDSAVRRHALFVFGWLVFSCAAVCPGLYFRSHYFILMMPAIALLIAVAVTSATHALAARPVSRWLHALPAIVFAIACLLTVRRAADYYFKMTPIQACRFTYHPNPFPEMVPVAEYLRQHTSPDDTIMVFGSEPEIYFDAHRHSASGYIYFYGLMEEQAYWADMQEDMMREVDANRPAYIVVVNACCSWRLSELGSLQEAALRSKMDRYISDGFEPVAPDEVRDLESQYLGKDEVHGDRWLGSELIIYKRRG